MHLEKASLKEEHDLHLKAIGGMTTRCSALEQRLKESHDNKRRELPSLEKIEGTRRSRLRRGPYKQRLEKSKARVVGKQIMQKSRPKEKQVKVKAVEINQSRTLGRT
jgi:hypothetical protein